MIVVIVVIDVIVVFPKSFNKLGIEKVSVMTAFLKLLPLMMEAVI